MRNARSFGLALSLVLVPSVLGAQQMSDARTGFDNSWFWGAKAGIASIDPGLGRVAAPTFGAEWMVTRSRGALYLSVDPAFFDDVAGVFDPTAQGSVREVDVSNMRRYALGLLAFPVRYGSLRPYAGLGVSINVIQSVDPKGTYVDEASQTAVFERVYDQSSRVSAVATGGLQYQTGRLAWFGQVSAMPTRNRFLLSGASHTFMLEGGVRYNLVHAIDQLR